MDFEKWPLEEFQAEGWLPEHHGASCNEFEAIQYSFPEDFVI